MASKRSSKEIRWRYFCLIRRWLQASALLALLLSTATLQAQVEVVEVRDLGFPPGDTWSEAYDINNLGQVVSVSQLTEYWYSSGSSFLWTETGGIQEISRYRGFRAMGINDHSQIAGYYGGHGFGFYFYAALWEPGPTGYEELVCLSCFCDGHSAAYGVNNLGQVIGSCLGYEYNWDNTFVWSKEAGMRSLGGGQPFGINDLGQIVARRDFHAVLWKPVSRGYRIQDLGPGIPYAINNLGQIVGERDGHAVLWKPTLFGYKLQDLGTLGGASAAYGINDLGMVIGYSFTGPDTCHAFVWTVAGGMHDLGTLPDFSSSSARAINNLGQVVGSSQVLRWDPGYDWIAAKSHATRWTLYRTPTDQIAGMVASVEALVGTGGLTPARGKSLTSKLKAALAKLENYETQAAITKLRAFSLEVWTYVGSGKLNPVAGKLLITTTGQAVQGLSG